MLRLGCALAVLALSACAFEDRLALADWTLATEPPSSSRALQLPDHFEPAGGARPSRFVLRREVELPPAFLGRRLTLGFAKLGAPATLVVNGESAAALDLDTWSIYRSAGGQRWRISPEQSARGRLALELRLENTWAQSAWVDVTPTLSPTDHGDFALRALGAWNSASSAFGLTAALVTALLFAVLFALDRRRRDSAWFALEASSGALYPALNMSLLQAAVGAWDVPLAAAGVATAGLAGVHMMHAFLKLPRPHWLWTAGWAAQVATTLVAHGPFDATRWAASSGGLYLAAAAVYQVVGYRRAARAGSRSAQVLSYGWLGLLGLGGVDILGWLGAGSWFGGWQGAGIGIFMLAITQALNLTREHAAALATAESLNAELQARVAALEASNRQVGQLNEELRHQIRARSAELADGFSRQVAEVVEEAAPMSEGDVVSGRYRLDRHLGSGGMGVVFQATRLSDGLVCALKAIKHQRSPERLARLSREAMVLADITHPNIVRILDIDVAGGRQPFIVMEYVDGVSLDRRSDAFGTVAFALPVIRQAASALAAVHERNFVHRDLKPSNILLVGARVESPQVKLVDFGLARSEPERETLAELAHSTGTGATWVSGRELTRSGTILGTPLYMAPEYVSGSSGAGAAADLFSLGVIAYELLTARKPFSEVPITAALNGRPLTLDAPLSGLRPELRPAVVDALEACLRDQPEGRPSARELVTVLDG